MTNQLLLKGNVSTKLDAPEVDQGPQFAFLLTLNITSTTIITNRRRRRLKEKFDVILK